MTDSKTVVEDLAAWREALEEMLSDHYWDANWPRQHHGSRCGCGWMGEDHVGHVAGVLLAWIEEAS